MASLWRCSQRVDIAEEPLEVARGACQALQRLLCLHLRAALPFPLLALLAQLPVFIHWRSNLLRVHVAEDADKRFKRRAVFRQRTELRHCAGDVATQVGSSLCAVVARGLRGPQISRSGRLGAFDGGVLGLQLLDAVFDADQAQVIADFVALYPAAGQFADPPDVLVDCIGAHLRLRFQPGRDKSRSIVEVLGQQVKSFAELLVRPLVLAPLGDLPLQAFLLGIRGPSGALCFGDALLQRGLAARQAPHFMAEDIRVQHGPGELERLVQHAEQVGGGFRTARHELARRRRVVVPKRLALASAPLGIFDITIQINNLRADRVARNGALGGCDATGELVQVTGRLFQKVGKAGAFDQHAAILVQHHGLQALPHLGTQGKLSQGVGYAWHPGILLVDEACQEGRIDGQRLQLRLVRIPGVLDLAGGVQNRPKLGLQRLTALEVGLLAFHLQLGVDEAAHRPHDGVFDVAFVLLGRLSHDIHQKLRRDHLSEIGFVEPLSRTGRDLGEGGRRVAGAFTVEHDVLPDHVRAHEHPHHLAPLGGGVPDIPLASDVLDRGLKCGRGGELDGGAIHAAGRDVLQRAGVAIEARTVVISVGTDADHEGFCRRVFRVRRHQVALGQALIVEDRELDADVGGHHAGRRAPLKKARLEHAILAQQVENRVGQRRFPSAIGDLHCRGRATKVDDVGWPERTPIRNTHAGHPALAEVVDDLDAVDERHGVLSLRKNRRGGQATHVPLQAGQWPGSKVRVPGDGCSSSPARQAATGGSGLPRGRPLARRPPSAR
mmetsp:Transcript_7410/g.13720  ORF Transcript_7410/g.13720 Transcript_7410/m.13720 type:complete len:779 (+) Transcript_7410:735-3071(+)